MFYFIFTSIAGATLIATLTLILHKHRKHNPAVQPEYMPPTDLTEWDLRSMAYHEAGHAVCSCFLPEREDLILITIDPSSEAFGMIKTRERPHHNETKISLSSSISTLLAGRLSEEIFLGTVTTSCIHDLASAHKLAFNMVAKFGMGKNYGLSVFDDTDSFGISETQLELMYADIQQIIKDAEHNARIILEEHRSLVITLAEKLLEQKTLFSDEIIFFLKNEGMKKL